MPTKSSQAVASVFGGTVYPNIGNEVESLLLTGNPEGALQKLKDHKLVDEEIKFGPGEVEFLQNAAVGSESAKIMAGKYRLL